MKNAVSVRGVRHFILLAILLPPQLFLPCFSAFSDDEGGHISQTLFGPETFTRANGTTYNRTFNVPATQGSFKLHVVNGDGAGHNKVSSATIKVNGTTVVRSSDLNQQVNHLDKTLTNLVNGSNSLTVQISSSSSPSSYLTVSIIGTYLLDVRITDPPDGTQEPNDHVTVQGTYSSYTNIFSIDVNGVSASASNGSFTAYGVPLAGGSNNVTATIATVNGLSDTHTISLTLNRPPVAEAGADRNVTAGYGVTLDGRNSYDPEGALISYRWYFASRPAGSASSLVNPTSVNPSFVPDLPGSYVVSLMVNDGVQDSLPDNVTVTAAVNSPPTANAGPDQSVSTGSPVQLDGRGSFDPEGAPLLYSWSFLSLPTGSGANLNADNSAMPVFTADLDGMYTVELTVSDGLLTSLPDNVSIVAAQPNAPPVAYAGMDLTAYRNTTVLLDGMQSYDPDNDVLTYRWSIVSKPQGSTAELDNTSAARPSLHLDLEGDYVLRLVVNDGYVDSAPDTVVITSVNAVPVAEAGPDQVVSIETLVTLDGSGSSDGNGDPLTFAWSIASAPAGSAAALSDPSASGPTFTPDLAGQYVVRLVVGDGWVTSAPDNVTVTAWPPILPVPSVLGMTQSDAQGTLVVSGLTAGVVTTGYSDTVAAGRVMSQVPGYGALVNRQFPVDFVVSQGPVPLPNPPDPVTVAPPTSPDVATTVVSSTRFLYEGSDPIQRDVVPGTIEAKRSAVIRGIVKTRDGTPLPGVAVTVLYHPEFGRTVTRADGMFDMAVNGGGLLTVDYRKAGYLPAQRQVNARWQDYIWAADVVMVPYDTQVTVVDLAVPVPVQVARGSEVTDSSGTRRPTLLVPQGTPGQMVLPDNSLRSLSIMNVRVTEFTVGPTGPSAMPAPLPPSSGYTHAVDLSVDEAVAAGAMAVVFANPIYYYVENFLQFPIGTPVPVAYYDMQKGVWVPSPNGRVIKVLSITGGLADLDTDGDGVSDNAATLGALGINDAEREQLAALYPPGQGLWRVPISHLSPQDCNWPVVFPSDASTPTGRAPQNDGKSPDPNQICTTNGSVIECQSQILGESVPITGTPFSLNYRSDRVPGRKADYTLTIPLSGPSIPASLKRIDLEVHVAGRLSARTFPPAINSSATFSWDGMDAYGRSVQGTQAATIRIGYVYDSLYALPAENGASFGLPGTVPLPGSPARGEGILWREWTSGVGNMDFHAQGFGGWMPSMYHLYDPVGQAIHLGDGGSRGAGDINKIITTVARYGSNSIFLVNEGPPADYQSLGNPYGVAVSPDGTAYIADASYGVILRIGQDGVIRRVAGNFSGVCYLVGYYGGDGGPATQACLNLPTGVAVSQDGSIYIADSWNNRIRRVGPDGIITTVAGNGMDGYSGDGGPASQASLSNPMSVAAGPDGSIYIADTGNFNIRRVGSDGIITRLAGSATGNPGYGSLGDGGPATLATLNAPTGVAVGPDGSVYIASNGGYWPWADVVAGSIRRVSPDGIITTVAGNEQWYGVLGDGGPATQATLNYPVGVTVGPDGSIYIADSWNGRIRRVGTDGIISTVAGKGINSNIIMGDGGPASQASLDYPYCVAIGPNGDLFIGEYTRIRKVSSSFPGLSFTETAVSSEDGKQLYVFTGSGRHLRTLDTVTGALRYRFDYDGSGNLVQIVDGDNNVTTIERDSGGNPTAIVASGGQRTMLALDINGYLSTVTNPAGDNVGLFHRSDGLLDHIDDIRGYRHAFQFDALGRLERDDDPAGGFKTLLRTGSGDGANYAVDVSTALGRTTRFEIDSSAAGATDAITTFPGGARSISRLVGAAGVLTSWSPDNTVTEVQQGPDPRFGMQAPIPKSSNIWTPEGLVRTESMTRTATLADPNDLLSLHTQTDTRTVNGRTYTTVFDNTILRFTTTSPAGRRTASSIDGKGRLLSGQADNTYSPPVYPVQFSYDTQGRLSQAGQGNNLWTYVYDNSNRLWKTIDPLDNTVEYGYDNADRVSQVTLPSGRTYGFGYDAGGNRTQVTMPNGAVHSLGYTPVNLDNAYVPPGNLPYIHGYSLDRERIRTTLPSGRSVDAAYDPVSGRLQSVTFPEGSVVYGYADNTERVFSLARASATDSQAIDFSYDGFLTTKAAISGAANGEYRYAYDNNFWVRWIALDNAWLPLNRDDDGLPTQYGSFTIGRGGPAGAADNVSDLVPAVCGTDAGGQPVPCITGNMAQYYGYDNTGRLSLRTQAVNGTPVYEVVLDRDPAGRIVRKTETLGADTSTFEYGYDVDGQLIEVRRNGTLWEQYGYDNNANRNLVVTQTPARNLAAGDFDYDPQDRLGRMGTVSYVFDADGYLAHRGSDNIVYSARGELLSATAGGQTIAYAYDGTGRRVARTDTAGTTQYLYGSLSNPFQVTASRSPDNVLTVYYYDDYGALYALERGGVRYYIGSDHLGTPKVVTDNTGAIVRQMEYDSWGVKISDVGDTSFDLPVGFAGGIPDDATGLVRFGFRDYEPESGRWAAKDPIFFRSGQPNLYAYAQEDPVNFNDPSGLKDSDSASWGYYRVYKGIRMIAMPFYMGGIAGFYISPLGGVLTGLAFSGNIYFGIKEIEEGINEIKEGQKTTSGGGSSGGTCPIRRRQFTIQP